MIFRRKKGLYYTTVYVVNFPPSFYRKIYFNFLVWRDIHRMTSTKTLSLLFCGDYYNRYHIHSPRIQSHCQRCPSRVYSLKFGRYTKVILPTPVCLFILYAAMAGTNEIYVTIICDLLVLLTPVYTERPGCPGYEAGWNVQSETERPGCLGYEAGWNVQSEIENSLSLWLIVDCNLLSVVILLYPSMLRKFKIVDRFQCMREPHFAFAKVCNFLVNLVTTYQGSLLPVPGNEVVLSPITGCVKSMKKLRCEMSYLYYH